MLNVENNTEINQLYGRSTIVKRTVCVTLCNALTDDHPINHLPYSNACYDHLSTQCWDYYDMNSEDDGGGGNIGSSPSGNGVGGNPNAGGGSNSGTPLVTTPVYGGTLSDVTSKSPCGQMNLASQDQTFKDNLTYLNENTGLDYEVGIFQIPPSPTQIQNQYSIVNGTSGGNDIPALIIGQITAYMHTHYDVDTQLSVFSLVDIKTIYDLIIAGNIKNPKTFTAVLVTAHGTKYALKITDVYNFKTFCQSYFDGWQNPSVEKIIEDKHELLNNIRIKNSNTVNEESFAKFLSKNNVGMSFLKCTNDNFTEWSEIVVQSNGLVESYPCNN